MRRSFFAVPLLAAAACVDVPDAIHAQFAPVSPSERTNYRPGRHGTAPPVETPSPVPAATDGGPSAVGDRDAASEPALAPSFDGGTT